MAASALTLAKKTKAVMLAHQSLVELDGTQDVPSSFNFNFGGELREAGDNLRAYVGLIADAVKQELRNTAFSELVPQATDDSREAGLLRNQLFAHRALTSIQKSANGLLKSKFQIRTYGVEEIKDALSLESSAQPLAELDDYSAVLQFKRHDEDANNQWIFSWMFTVEGVSVSRGVRQPIHKMITSLLKLVIVPVSDTSVVQAALAELAKFKGNSKPYYWYVSNKDTAMWYQAFAEYLALSSCMSKSNDYYNHTGPRQHPMDCYDNSPDWRLMTISERSPEEIIEMCDLVLANPAEADSLFKFPFLSRCLALPTSKETSGKDVSAAPYIMGKFYGNDKLIKFFYDDRSDSDIGVYHKNNNGLLLGSYYIDGGRIPAIPTTRAGEEGTFLLPYFDRHNKARLVVEDDQTWWVSVGKQIDKYREPVAKCAYEYGSARFEYFWSPSKNGYRSINSFCPQTFETIFGPELEDFRESYIDYSINGNVQSIPNKMFVAIDGVSVLRGEVTSLYDGTQVISANVINNQERYLRIAGFGLFDMQNSAHAGVYSTLNNSAE